MILDDVGILDDLDDGDDMTPGYDAEAERKTTRMPADFFWQTTPLGDWARRAACKGKPPEWFDAPDLTPLDEDEITDTHAKMRLAASTCIACPVRVDCYAHATESNEVGVWGGHIFPERGTPRDLIALLNRGYVWSRKAAAKRRNDRLRIARKRSEAAA